MYDDYIDQYIHQKDWANRPKFLIKKDFLALMRQGDSHKRINVLKKPIIWVTTSGKEVSSEYPPEEEATFPHLLVPTSTIVSSPYKTINEEKTKTIGLREIKNIQQQLNYSNKVLTTLSKSVEEMKSDRNVRTIICPDRVGLHKVDPNRSII